MSASAIDELTAWLAQLPPHVRAVFERYPSYDAQSDTLICYRSTENRRFHYVITAYSEDTRTRGITLSLHHGADSTLPGLTTFGQPPEQLIPCKCGKWRQATPDEQAETLRRTMAMHKRGLA